MDLIGQTISRYRIVEKLGEGGMGVVYRADDLRLGREVALKFLRAEVSRDSRLFERFQAEARAASALSHPHICTVHDIDHHEGHHFIVMELLKGSTLAARMQGGSFPAERILEIGVQLADALAAAHAKGIVHRDVKPGNVFLTERSEVKLLDFGIAKLQMEVSGATTSAVGLAIALGSRGDGLTRPEETLGTLAYMSPEQIRRRTLDGRTDLFSLGAVLYELASGSSPFPGTTGAELAHAILYEDPAPPSELGSPVPPELEDLILKTLQKRPELRPPTAEDLRADLLRVRRVLARSSDGPTPVPGTIASLAVLPLESLSDDREQGYLADGMTEALIAHLSKIRSARVVSRTSAMTYRNTSKPLRQIARELRVRGIVEGTVLRSENQVRVTARLIRAADESCIWSETYDREMREILTLQSDLAQAIAGEIRVALRPEERKRLGKARAVVPEAHAAFLRGRYHLNKGTPESAQAALREFETAVGQDPGAASAWAGVAEAYLSMGCRTYETLHPSWPFRAPGTPPAAPSPSSPSRTPMPSWAT